MTLANGTATVSAQVTDALGNQSALASQTVTVAETLPTVSINAIDGNNVINARRGAGRRGAERHGERACGRSTFNVTVTDGASTRPTPRR